MNRALQTQEIPHDPTLLKPRAAKKLTNELKTKSRSTSAKKKVLVGAKSPTRRKATKAGPSAKAAPRKIKPGIIKDNLPAPIALVPQPIFALPGLPIQPDLPVQEAPAISEPAVKQLAFLTADRAFEPVPFEDPLDLESRIAAESIPAPEFIEPLVGESLESKLETFNEPNPPAETVARCEADMTTSEDPVPEVVKETPPTPLARFWKSMTAQLTELWHWAQEKFRSHQVRKRLRVCETVSLGEKRFLAVVQVDGEQFLVGGSSSSVSTLAHLERSRDFSDVFQRHCEQDLSRA